MTINLPRGPLAAFRRKALKRHPKEYGEVLYGRVGRNGINVRRFSTVGFLNGTEHFWHDPEKVPTRIGKSVLLGLIHTHPNSDAAPGDDDWNLALENQYILHGICSVNPEGRPKTRIAFYLGTGGMLRTKLF